MEIKSTANYPYVFVVYLKKGLQRQKERKREQIIQRKKLTRENLFDLSFSFLFFSNFTGQKILEMTLFSRKFSYAKSTCLNLDHNDCQRWIMPFGHNMNSAGILLASRTGNLKLWEKSRTNLNAYDFLHGRHVPPRCNLGPCKDFSFDYQVSYIG